MSKEYRSLEHISAEILLEGREKIITKRNPIQKETAKEHKVIVKTIKKNADNQVGEDVTIEEPVVKEDKADEAADKAVKADRSGKHYDAKKAKEALRTLRSRPGEPDLRSKLKCR